MQGQTIVIMLLIGALFINESMSSSIPMFEFLTRDEKVRKLFVKILSESDTMKNVSLTGKFKVKCEFCIKKVKGLKKKNT